MFDRSSLSEQVEIALKEEITSGRIQPGGRIDMGSLVAAWNISTTPFRDAVRALEQQGFVKVEARKGIYVIPLGVDAVNEIFDLRIALECMAVERATMHVSDAEASAALKDYLDAEAACRTGNPSLIDRIDRRVHEISSCRCGNFRLQKALAGEMELIRWAQSTIVSKLPDAYEQALPEHIAIMRAICARDAVAAASAMRLHLERSRNRLLDAVEKESHQIGSE